MSSTPSRSSEATLFEILDALDTAQNAADCAVCLLTARSVANSLRAFFAEFVNDPEARELLRRARGFCPEHTMLLASLGDALAVAILYSDLAEQTRERWQAEKPGVRSGLRVGLGRRVKGVSAPCPACVDSSEAEARYTRALAANLEDERLWNALEAGNGLCIAHAEQVMKASAPASAERLRVLESERLARLQAELEEIIRKNDYRFRGEEWGPEKDAWLRALKKISRS